jgi:hypothetical protein
VGEVVEFPAPTEKEWRLLEKTLLGILTKADLSAEVVRWVLDDMKPRYFAIAAQGPFDLTVPEQCAPHIKAVAAYLSEGANRALVELLKLEVELYRARFGDGLPGADGL